MTFQKTVSLQLDILNWINENLKPIKQFNFTYGRSMQLLRYLQRDIPEATHEDFKQAMARAGYFANCEHTGETYSKVCFNVSEKSVRKLMDRESKAPCESNRKWMEGMF